jgi:hypothetical protein
MLPAKWLNRSLRCEYTGADCKAQETQAVLLDWCPAGVLLGIAGAKTLLSWDRLVFAQLREDR